MSQREVKYAKKSRKKILNYKMLNHHPMDINRHSKHSIYWHLIMHFYFYAKCIVSTKTELRWEFLSWIKEEKVFHCRPLDNFLQHFSSAVSKDANIRRTMWWIAVTTSIWRLRNDIIFQNQTFDITRLTDSTLFLLWTWLRGWERNFQIPYYSWSSNMSIAFS